MTVIGGLSNEFYWRLVQRIYIGGLSNGFFYLTFVQWVSKTKKIFCFENRFFFSYMVNACVRESVRTQDMGMTCRHSCRNVYVFT